MKSSFTRLGRKPLGFTLVELLVVIGIIAVLISILLPALSRAQRAAKTIQCSAGLRAIVQAMQIYAGQYNGAIPGSPHTTGAHIRTAADLAARPTYCARGVTPVTDVTMTSVSSIFDWQAPLAKIIRIPFPEESDTQKPNSRRIRQLSLLQNKLFTCPEQVILADPFGDSTFPIITHPSYSTNIDFLLVRNTTANDSNTAGFFAGRINDWNMPQGYVPKITKVGNPSKKVYISEGSRFVTALGVATYTVGNIGSQQNGGAYADQRPYVALAFNRSKLLVGPYGTGVGSTWAANENPATILTAYRHGSIRTRQSINNYRTNLAFFDGHVETLNVIDSMNPEFHSPKGTEINTATAQVYPVVQKRYFNGQTLQYIVP